MSPGSAQCPETSGFSTRRRNPIEPTYFKSLRRQSPEFAEAEMARIYGEREPHNESKRVPHSSLAEH